MNKTFFVVIDTNVLVSALWSKESNPAKIAHLIPDGKIVPHFCGKILDEYRTVLSRACFDFSSSEVDELLRLLIKYGINIESNKSRDELRSSAYIVQFWRKKGIVSFQIPRLSYLILSF